MNVSTTGKSTVLEPEHASAGVSGVSAADQLAHIAAPIGADAAAVALRRGPIGALTLSVIAVSLLLLGWILFYFLLFLGRGPVG
jgi:hypothetical protein